MKMSACVSKLWLLLILLQVMVLNSIKQVSVQAPGRDLSIMIMNISMIFPTPTSKKFHSDKDLFALLPSQCSGRD